MKHSIRLRLVLILTLSLTSTIFLCWFLNKTFLASYYANYKVEAMGNIYSEVENIYREALEENALNGDTAASEELSMAMEKLKGGKDISVYVFQLENNQVGWQLYFLYPALDVFEQRNVMNQILGYAGMESDIGMRELLKSTEEYQIYKVFDSRLNGSYLEMLGILSDNTGIYVRSSYQSMMESAAISNRFLAYVGIMAGLIGSVVLFVVSKTFTTPILELSDIATRMANLDFEVRYQDKREDEVGILGNSMNFLSEKLEHTISELKTANNELKKDIEQKEQIDQMRTEFLSNVSHELKTPIALIQGYAEGLKDNVNDDAESREFYCDVIIDEANKMNAMVKKLLSLNQIESGKEPVSFERFDITALVSSILVSTEILFQQKEAVLSFEQKETIYVWADECRIEEVVTNYISNALNHVSGDRKIEVSILPKGDVVRIGVFNTGERIPEEDLEKVWDKFYKVDKARTREYGGNGIGLSIVKAIMNSHNQKYGVINHQEGVEFWFELDMKNE